MWNLAQYTYTTHSNSGGSPAIFIIYGIFGILAIIANWKIFTKAGQKGWKAIIPIYNTVKLLNIVGMSGWYTLLFFVPIVNIVFYIVILNKLSKCFGYGAGMTVLSFFIIGLFILGFGSAKYKGPEAASQGPTIPDAPYPKKS